MVRFCRVESVGLVVELVVNDASLMLLLMRMQTRMLLVGLVLVGMLMFMLVRIVVVLLLWWGRLELIMLRSYELLLLVLWVVLRWMWSLMVFIRVKLNGLLMLAHVRMHHHLLLLQVRKFN